MPYKQIAARLCVSPATAFSWTRDIVLTEEQLHRNLRGPESPQDPDLVSRRGASWSRRARQRRHDYQREGRARARDGDPLHMAGCMLYWAEGAKNRNSLALGNSDVNMLRLFARFLRESLQVPAEEFRIRLNVYTSNGRSIEQIEAYWLEALDLPRSCLRRGSLNHYPTSSSGAKRNRLPYGVCTIKVARSTRHVQHIFGAIQEYAGFDEPRWLDQLPGKRGRDPGSAEQ